MDQHIPEIQTSRGERSRLRQRSGPRFQVKKIAIVRAVNPLRQKVTSKLGAESRCRVTTPAMLQSKVTKTINETARECDIIFNMCLELLGKRTSPSG
jgi:hypothetical protein